MTLSGDQIEVFNYLVLQSLLLMAYLRKSNRQKIFFFQHSNFTVLIIVYSKAFSLWRWQKYHHRGTLSRNKMWRAADNDNYMCHICAKGLFELNFDYAVIDKISNFHEIIPILTYPQKS